MDISTIDDIELETYITEVMLDIGVPAHLKGYYYLRDAIMMTGRDMDVVSSVTKLMYPVIARRFKTTDQKVERAIRNAIEVSWQRGNANTFAKLFGYSLQEGKNRPTNSEYIARIADKVRMFPKNTGIFCGCTAGGIMVKFKIMKKWEQWAWRRNWQAKS